MMTRQGVFLRPRVAPAGLRIAAMLPNAGCGRPGLAVLQTIAVVGLAAAVVLAVHDAHMHSYRCGHETIIVDDRPVYYYQDRWEYYDAERGQWYYYREDPRRHRRLE